MHDCRKQLLDSLRVLAKYVEPHDLEGSPLTTIRCVVRSFHHYYSVWRFNFENALDSVNRAPLDELYHVVDEMLDANDFLREGYRRDWEVEAIRSGPKWIKIRGLAKTSFKIAEGLAVPNVDSGLSSTRLKIISYTEERIPNPPLLEELEPTEDGYAMNDYYWYWLRKELVLVCGKHGHVGPDDPNSVRHFWVVDDRYNEERYQYMEALSSEHITVAWFEDVLELLQSYPGWGIGVSNFPENYLLIFGDRLMVNGNTLPKCKSIEGIVEAMKALASK